MPRDKLRFFVSIRPPLPTDGHLGRIEVNPLVTELAWTTQAPGGFGTANIGMAIDEDIFPKPYLENALQVPPFGHVQILVASRIAYEGRVITRTRPGGHIRGFQCAGYGTEAMNDDWYRGGNQDNSTSGRVLLDVMSTAAPLIRVETGAGLFVDPSAAHMADEFRWMTPSAALGLLCSEGGFSDVTSQWDYFVWENRNLRFIPRLAPDTPRYSISFDESVEWEESFENMYSEVAMAYTLPDGTQGITATHVDTTAQGMMGFSRRKLLRGAAETSTAAYQFAQTWLAVNSRPQVSATISRESGRGLTLTEGGEDAGWEVRAGQWIQVGSENPQMIIQTDFNASNETLNIQLSNPMSRQLTSLLARFYRHYAMARNNLSALTGAKI